MNQIRQQHERAGEIIKVLAISRREKALAQVYIIIAASAEESHTTRTNWLRRRRDAQVSELHARARVRIIHLIRNPLRRRCRKNKRLARKRAASAAGKRPEIRVLLARRDSGAYLLAQWRRRRRGRYTSAAVTAAQAHQTRD